MEAKTDYKKGFTLSKYWNDVYMSFSNISFSPEKRADMYVKDYSEELDQDLQELGEKQGNYREKYEARFTAWIRAKSMCISSMITGPSNFPVRKAEKANRSESNRYDEFRHWREKYFKAVNRVKTPSPEDDLEQLNRKLDDAIILNENIKEWNKIIRKYKKEKITRDTLFNELIAIGISDKLLKTVDANIDERWFQQIGTMGTTIRRYRERAEALKVRIERKENWDDIEFEDGHITIEDDRVKIFHDSKPEQEVINNLKSNGFRWSRHWNCWSRKHTGAAIVSAKRILNIKL